jgi:hypothetical protein
MATQILVPPAETEQAHAIPFPQQITQVQLTRVISIRNMIESLKGDLEVVETQVKSALEAGVPIEPGVHIARLRDCFRRTVSWREVAERLAERIWGAGRGEAYCANVLEHTAPSRTVSLVVS